MYTPLEHCSRKIKRRTKTTIHKSLHKRVGIMSLHLALYKFVFELFVDIYDNIKINSSWEIYPPIFLRNYAPALLTCNSKG